ncbi:MAG: hypothetical protein OXH81_15390 [Gemmatimonadetes bacterium]|nr:hypothetical protein [Gemmatimonadota bacterium]MDE2735827.1 hypothetical protein [Gemmatimonadota bacterium]
MIAYAPLVGELDQQVKGVLTRQVLDAESPHRGGFMDGDRLVGSQSISAVASLGYAYLLAESRHYRSEEFLQRILLAAEFARRHRKPSGCFDLLTTNFDSAPDTGFVVQAIAPVVFAARQQAADDAGAAAIAEALGELIQTGAPGMVAGGFHTPNHRWVLVAALAQAQALYPELEVSTTVDAYLGEGIDINADGEYSERSTGVYNAVVNRALIRAAQVLARPDLLEPVRRNLDLSYHLLHADATAVTSISTRQDRDTRAVPTGLADGYHALAHLDDNGLYAAVADWLVARGGSGLVCLPNYVLYPEWRATCIERTPLPEHYSRVYPASGLWRVRRGAVSATAAAGLTAPFSVVCGQAELAAVKISSTYFATGQFIGEEFAEADKGVRMQHKGRNRIYPEKDYVGGIYWLPIAEQVNAQNWREVRGRRATYELPPLEVELHAEEVAGGFDLHIRSTGGMDGVPFQIEGVFEPGGTLEMDSALVEGRAGHTIFLKAGYALYRVGDDAIRLGPGAMEHTMWRMRNSEIDEGRLRVLIALRTPVARTLEIRCGQWSDAQGGFL